MADLGTRFRFSLKRLLLVVSIASVLFAAMALVIQLRLDAVARQNRLVVFRHFVDQLLVFQELNTLAD
jgi:hypothetical protein